MASWEGRDTKLPQGRLTFCSYAVVGVVCLLLLGFWKLQVLDSGYYAQLAERNRIRSIPVIAPRGKMLDRDGRVVVDNYPSFSVLVLREDQALLEQHLKEIAEGLEMEPDDLQQQIDAARALPRFNPIVVKPEATPADIAFIESHRADLPLLELLMVHRRKYPGGGFLAHTIGYVGEVNEKQIEASAGRLRPGDIAGKSGLEKTYNDTLMGADGMRRVIVNSLGKEVGRLEQKEAVSGKPIQLTIDYDLQVAAENALGPQQGAVVALDPHTGEVLAMASHPMYDPKDFAVRVSKEQWQQLNEDPARPLLNRTIQAQLAPGSVFKVVMATAMLESKAVPEDFSVTCSGAEDFYGRQFKCHIFGKGAHGRVDLHDALVKSCDIFFYNLGKRLGIDRISYYALQLGLGRKTGIDLPGEQEGLMPSEDWKKRVYKQKWYPGETISVAVGQGAITTTPLQLARMVAGVAMGGVFHKPHLILGAKDMDEPGFPISEETTEKVTQGLFGVVNEAGGTAHAVHLEGIEFCGKTGSAQIISNEGKSRAGGHVGKDLADNAWFVGFAPRRNPEIVVAVLVEHGLHGATAAAPVARDIIKAYYDKKSHQEKKNYTVELKHYELDHAETAKALAAVVDAGEAKKDR
ncbi:MAG TPA: penicillin-binding protein 2 [Candidatus Solibacter sp.]|nr:penicillin-binding protein 2 [Candidatus Solibacter sp.]